MTPLRHLPTRLRAFVVGMVLVTVAALVVAGISLTRSVIGEPDPVVIHGTVAFHVTNSPVAPGEALEFSSEPVRSCNTTGERLVVTIYIALRPLDGQTAPPVQTFVTERAAHPRCTTTRAGDRTDSLPVPVLGPGRWAVTVLAEIRRIRGDGAPIQTLTLRSAQFRVEAP